MPNYRAAVATFVADYQENLAREVGAEQHYNGGDRLPGRKYLGLVFYQSELGDDPIPHRLIPYSVRFYLSLVSVVRIENGSTARTVTRAKFEQEALLNEKLFTALNPIQFGEEEGKIVEFRRLLPSRAFNHQDLQQVKESKNWEIITVGEFEMQFLVKLDKNLQGGQTYYALL